MIEVTLNGKWALKLPKHRADRPEWQTGWEVFLLNSLHANINLDDVVFDIGTEEGDMSALMASWGARMVLFEPNPRVWPNPKAIWEANHLSPPLAVWNGFADHETDEAGRRALLNRDYFRWPNTAYGEIIGDHGFCRPEERPDLPHTTIDDFAAYSGIIPDIITMDVEGSELRVVRGAEKVLREHRPLVYVSVHPEFMLDTYGVDVKELFDFMEGWGYTYTHLGTDHEEHWAFAPPTRTLVAS